MTVLFGIGRGDSQGRNAVVQGLIAAAVTVLLMVGAGSLQTWLGN